MTYSVKTSFRRSLVLVSFLLVVGTFPAIAPGHLLAATYYVDINQAQASDSNPGSEALPWRTLSKAAATLVAGDTVLVKAGTYSGTVPLTKSGQPGKPITYKAHSGHQVILTGDPQGGTLVISGASYNVIDGFTSSGAPIGVNGQPTARVVGNVVQNNTIHDIFVSTRQTSCAICMTGTSGTIVRNNRLFNIKNQPHPWPNSAAVLLYWNDNAIIENNEIYQVDAAIFEKDSGSSNTYRYNFIRDFYVGIWMVASNGHSHADLKAHNNVLARGLIGIGVAASPQTGERIDNVQVYANVVVDTPRDNAIGISPGATNAQLWNNLVPRSLVAIGPFSPPPASNPALTFCDYNLFFRAGNSPCGTHHINADPLLVNSTSSRAEDFKLQPASPARGKGRNGENIGAYSTGNEVIGLTTLPQSDTTTLAAPTSLVVK